MIQSVLIANRGEIACRIMRTAKRLGIRTIAVYSDADRDSPHVIQADHAISIGPAEVTASYLNSDAILNAAKQTGAESIHPGYGFLSENSEFAAACQARGITFIGPSSEAIELMGNKRAAKLAVEAAQVPCVPGYAGIEREGSNPDERQKQREDDAFIDAAATIGFPLLIKATAGGGGRGMRIVDAIDAMPGALQSARSEALNAFGSDELILEKYIESPRHIEIQIFADQQGNTIHLGERDCSIQRRHQKVIEESPSPALSSEQRDHMGAAAVAAAKACHYVGAGTVEFITDPEGNFYFLEMNTRLQVEHPVTEWVTGVDLVEWQFKVANAEPLPLKQGEVTQRGHAIEARLYAEDVQQQFLPQTGTIKGVNLPDLPHCRIDHAVAPELTVSPYYDPMLGKWIAWGEDRASALQTLITLLSQTTICGVTHNRAFLLKLLKHEQFQQGHVSTHFIDQHSDTLLQAGEIEPLYLMATATFLSQPAYPPYPRREAGTFQRSSALKREILLTLSHNGQRYPLRGQWIDHNRLQWCTEAQQERFITQAIDFDATRSTLTLSVNGVTHKIAIAQSGHTLFIDTEQGHLILEDLTYPTHSILNGDLESEADSGSVTAPMDGKIVAIYIEAGQRVAQGDTLMVIEAMKMEHPVKARQDGLVSRIDVEAHQQATRNQLLATIDGA